MEAATAAPSALSLVEQIERLSPPAEQPDPVQVPEEGTVLSGGYERNSPVQPYRVPPGYRRQRRIRLIVTAALIVIAVILLAAFMPRLLRLIFRMVK